MSTLLLLRHALAHFSLPLQVYMCLVLVWVLLLMALNHKSKKRNNDSKDDSCIDTSYIHTQIILHLPQMYMYTYIYMRMHMHGSRIYAHVRAIINNIRRPRYAYDLATCMRICICMCMCTCICTYACLYINIYIYPAPTASNSNSSSRSRSRSSI